MAQHADDILHELLTPLVDWRSIQRTNSVLHVCALHDRGDGFLYNIRIGAHSPKSAEDWRCLNLARALASAVITSGNNLRTEGGHPVEVLLPDLAAWRVAGGDVRGGSGSSGAGAHTVEPDQSIPIAASPIGVLITRGHDIDPHWPFFYAGSVVVCTRGGEALAGLHATFTRTGLQPPQVVVAAAPSPDLPHLSLRAVLAYVRASVCHTGIISIECGPTLTRPLYESADETAGCDEEEKEEGCPVDWLLLSVYKGPLHPDAAGERVLSLHRLHTLFEAVSSSGSPSTGGAATEHSTKSSSTVKTQRGEGTSAGKSTGASAGTDAGVWSFTLYRRRSAART